MHVAKIPWRLRRVLAKVSLHIQVWSTFLPVACISDGSFHISREAAEDSVYAGQWQERHPSKKACGHNSFANPRPLAFFAGLLQQHSSASANRKIAHQLGAHLVTSLPARLAVPLKQRMPRGQDRKTWGSWVERFTWNDRGQCCTVLYTSYSACFKVQGLWSLVLLPSLEWIYLS